MDRVPLLVKININNSVFVLFTIIFCLELLLKHQVDVTACDRNKNTALHWACLKKHCHTALLLLEYADVASTVVNMTNVDGKT